MNEISYFIIIAPLIEYIYPQGFCSRRQEHSAAWSLLPWWHVPLHIQQKRWQGELAWDLRFFMASRKCTPWAVQLQFQPSCDIRDNTHPLIKMTVLLELISLMVALLKQGKSLTELTDGAQQQPGTNYERKRVKRGEAHAIAVPISSHICWHGLLQRRLSCRMQLNLSLQIALVCARITVNKCCFSVGLSSIMDTLLWKKRVFLIHSQMMFNIALFCKSFEF